MSIISKIGYSPLKETLGKDALFKLPKYQRGYDWEEGYVGDLIEDINALIERKRLALEQDKEEEITLNHFFGGIILVEIDKTVQKNGYLVERTVYDIVDGQQRITTFVLILHLISKKFKRIAESTDTLIDLKDDIKKEEKDELKDLINSCSEIRKTIVDNYVYWKHQTYHDIREIKLTLARRDQDFFEQLIKEHNPDPVYSSNERLKNAKKKIEKELIDPIVEEAESNHEEYEKLSELYNTVVNRCEFVNLITDNEKHANKLFSVINDRGKGLSETNLIRSRMMKIIEGYPKKQEKVEKLWDTILLREEDSESFLRDFYTSVVGDSPKINNLHGPFEDDIIKGEYDIDINLDEVINESHAQRVVNLARALEDEATAYYQIIDGDWPFEESKVDTWYERRLLRLANVLGHKKAFPVLLSAWNTGDQDLFASMVHLLEIFMFRYIILGNGRPSSLDDSYNPISKELRAKEENANLGQFVNSLMTLVENDSKPEQVRSNFPDVLEYNSRSSVQKRRIRHALTTLESYYRWTRDGSDNENRNPKKDLLFDLSNTTIEHVYPRKPTDDNYDPDLDVMKNYIGNLTVLDPGENSSLGNLPFQDKKTFFKNESSLQINRDIGTSANWDVRRVECRSDSIINNLLHIFYPFYLDNLT